LKRASEGQRAASSVGIRFAAERARPPSLLKIPAVERAAGRARDRRHGWPSVRDLTMPWISTTPSRVRCTSLSRIAAPVSSASAKEGSVFSGASPALPRWPITVGVATSK
jgi:hypothetical protein